jgi:molybdenum-dependent DNA-binding transcriptional regulator ModE
MNGILEMTKCMNQNVDERILNGMSAFAAIVQCGSFAGAGKALNMSQSGVSRSIARLEARLAGRVIKKHDQVIPALILKPLVPAAIDVQQHAW